VIEWVKQFLTDRKQMVKNLEGIEECSSLRWLLLEAVSPRAQYWVKLFSIYLHDVPKIHNSKVSLYADDSKLIGCVDTAENIESTQLDLDAVTHWTNIWKLEFNAAKCKTPPGEEKSTHSVPYEL